MELKEIRSGLIDKYIKLFPAEVAVTFNSFTAGEIVEFIENQPVDVAEEILTNLSPDVVATVIERMDEPIYLSIFEAIDPYTAAKLLSRTKKSLLDRALKLLSERKSNSIREMLSYPPEAAGYLMDTRITTFNAQNTVDQVLNKLRSIGDKKMVNLYVNKFHCDKWVWKSNDPPYL